MKALYDLIAPEHKSLEHQVHLYRGLAETGESSLESALRSGFVRIREGQGTEEQDLFLHEDALPDFYELVERVRTLREATDAPPESPETTALARAEQWQILRTQLTAQDPLTDDERRCLEEFVRRPSFALDLPNVEATLTRHRQSRAALAAATDEEAPCPCTSCQRTRAQRQLKHKQQARIVWGKRLQEKWDLVAYQEIVDKLFPPAQPQPRTEDVLRCYYQALWEAVQPEPPSPDDALQAQVTAKLTEALTELGATSNDQAKAKRALQVVQAYTKETLLPRWDEREKAWLLALESMPQPQESKETKRRRERLQGLFAAYRQRRESLERSYLGDVPAEEQQRALDAVLEECTQEVEAKLQAFAHQDTFRAVYAKKSDFASYFTEARALKRRLHFFCGPTNSGKTYQAFAALAQCESGVYLSPLRLLALEGQARLMDRGIQTSFLTGEERDVRKGARFISSTIEMLNPHKVIGGAIIDEIQMIAHPQRGWAWANALLGVPAYDVWMTGSPEVLPVLQEIAAHLQEPLEVHHCERFNTLTMLTEPADLAQLTPGTAIVCFSRRDVLGLKKEIEEQSSYKVAVVYGALAPQVRRHEAQRFREREAEILVATDAIGMGLNLPIKTLLFWSLEKVSRGIPRRLEPTEIKQIAGRAGRYGQEEEGYVGAFQSADIERISEVLEEPLPTFEGPIGVMPHPRHLRMLSETMQSDDMATLLALFRTEVWFEQKLLYPHVTDAMKVLAEELREALAAMPFEARLKFVRAPVPARSRKLLDEIKGLAEAFAKGEPLTIPPAVLLPFMKTHTAEDGLLRDAEEQVARLTLYSWLAYQFPERFEQAADADAYRHVLNRFISRSLRGKAIKRTCPRCGGEMPYRSTHRNCYQCYKDKVRAG